MFFKFISSVSVFFGLSLFFLFTTFHVISSNTSSPSRNIESGTQWLSTDAVIATSPQSQTVPTLNINPVPDEQKIDDQPVETETESLPQTVAQQKKPPAKDKTSVSSPVSPTLNNRDPVAPITPPTTSQPITDTAKAESEPTSKHLSRPATMTIEAIGLINTPLEYGSINNISDVDKKMLSAPVLENQLAADACTVGRNAYLMGHSSPAQDWQSKYPAAWIFESIGKNLLPTNSIIEITNRSGVTCSYRVSTVWIERTDDFRISKDRFQELFDPATRSGTITIQTCAIQSSSDSTIIDPINDMRMIRAELIT